MEVNLDQIKTVMNTPMPKSKKKLHCLTEKLVALGRFIARFMDKLRLFFLVLREANATRWTDNCQNAFEKIEHYLTQALILSSPQPCEQLYMYLVVSDWTVRVVLFHSLSHKEQRLVYFISRAMDDVETRY